MSDVPTKLREFIVDRDSLKDFWTLEHSVHFDPMPPGKYSQTRTPELAPHTWRQRLLAALLDFLKQTHTNGFALADLPAMPGPLVAMISESHIVSTAGEHLVTFEAPQIDQDWQPIVQLLALLSWVAAVVWSLAEPSLEPFQRRSLASYHW